MSVLMLSLGLTWRKVWKMILGPSWLKMLVSKCPKFCKAQGYTHIHFGAIRLAPTFHGRKGLPAFSHIALVDTRFVECQHACIEEAYKVEYDEDLPKKKKQSQSKLKKSTAAEDTLNWQSENAVAQNQALKAILIRKKHVYKNQEALAGKVPTIESIINDVRKKIQGCIMNNSLVASSKTPDVLPVEGVNPIFMFFQALTQQYSPKLFPCVPTSNESLFEEQDFSKDFEHLFLVEPGPIIENTFHYDYEAEEAASVAIPRRKKKFHRYDAKQKFTFDDILSPKWRERSIEMLTWCSAELQFYDIDM
ncbi:hypothetical protein R6Q57_021269, partial [Mikania cordata]